jgi:undecaprenyl-diphosphatase
MISYLQALILGFFQGVSELFPISSLGHSVLIAWLFNWHNIVANESRKESFFLSFLVILHVATALALLTFYRSTWVRIIQGFLRSLKTREIKDPDAHLAWLIIVASIPAGLAGLVFENKFRVLFAKPLAAIIFLMINGCILLVGDYYQKNRPRKRHNYKSHSTSEQVSDHMSFKQSALIGVAQIAALCAGISRSGITMVCGMFTGLSNEDAARFSFLLATPIILAAGLLKLPDFFGSLDAGSRPQIIVGGIAAAIGAYLSVRFLDKYFQNKGLRPFGIYCLAVGIVLLGVGALRGGF